MIKWLLLGPDQTKASAALRRAHEERGQDPQARWASSFDSPKGFVILTAALVAAAEKRRRNDV